jgi:hypothetical protein
MACPQRVGVWTRRSADTASAHALSAATARKVGRLLRLPVGETLTTDRSPELTDHTSDGRVTESMRRRFFPDNPTKTAIGTARLAGSVVPCP